VRQGRERFDFDEIEDMEVNDRGVIKCCCGRRRWSVEMEKKEGVDKRTRFEKSNKFAGKVSE
jgi:hypothetical protein